MNSVAYNKMRQLTCCLDNIRKSYLFICPDEGTISNDFFSTPKRIFTMYLQLLLKIIIVNC